MFKTTSDARISLNQKGLKSVMVTERDIQSRFQNQKNSKNQEKIIKKLSSRNSMQLYFERIDSYTDAAKLLGLRHVILYKQELVEKRLILRNFINEHIKSPAEVFVVEDDSNITSYQVNKKGVLKKTGELIITPFGKEPIRDENGLCVFGPYPSLRDDKDRVMAYYAKHVTKTSKEILLSTTSISLIKSFPWKSVGVNPKITAGYGKLITPTGQTVKGDFLKVQKWMNQMNFKQTGKSRETQIENKMLDMIRFNAYSYFEAASDREKMNQGDFSPKKLKKMDVKTRKTPALNNGKNIIAHNLKSIEERRDRAALSKGMQCNTCPIKEKCPAFEEDALCAFNQDFQALSKLFGSRNKNTISVALSKILESESERYARMVLFERIDPSNFSSGEELRKMSDSIMKNSEILMKIINGVSANNNTLIIQNNKSYNIGAVSREMGKLPSETKKQLLEIIEQSVDRGEPADYIE